MANSVTAVSTPVLILSKLPSRTHPATIELPPEILQGIGKVVVLWAYEEWLLTGVACKLMGIGRKQGRRLMNGRAEDARKNIRRTLKHRKMKAPKSLSKVERQVSYLGENRNRVGHGVWAKHTDTGQLFASADHRRMEGKRQNSRYEKTHTTRRAHHR